MQVRYGRVAGRGSSTDDISFETFAAQEAAATGENVVPLQPPLPVVGVSIGIQKGVSAE